MNLKNKNIKKITEDMSINIIATFIPIIFLQFISLPIIGRRYTEVSYGLMLTMVSLITIFSQSFSISLTNSRLLKNEKYIEENQIGDFNLILLFYMLFNILATTLGIIKYQNELNIWSIVFIIFISTLQLIRKYLLVSFRLEINYRNILNSNLYLILGYLIGTIFFSFTNKWEYIYFFGEIFSLIYILKKTDLLKEKFSKTKLFKETFKHSLIILVASFLGTANLHIDRLILFPILGGKAVTVYYVSSLFGKTLALLVAPINNVMLTYVVKMKGIQKKSFNLLMILSFFTGGICYFIIILLSESILKFLYPLYVQDSLKLIPITTLTSIILMISTLINPIIMKFCDIKWQMWINLFNNLNYIFLSLVFMKYYEIYGFCLAALISAVIKLILILIIYKRNISD